MADVKCWNCEGVGRTLAFCDRHNVRGEMEGELRRVSCYLCAGAGKITAERMKRYRVGQSCRDKRLAADLSQMEMAKQIGKRPSEISRMERGDCTDADIEAYAEHCDRLKGVEGDAG